MIQKARLKNLEHFGFGPNVMKKTKICSQCGRVAKANSSYCSKCGERLPPETLFDCYKKQHIDGNGTVTTMDAMRANSHARGVTLLTDYALKCADVVGTDGKVTTMDAMRINAHARGTAKLW